MGRGLEAGAARSERGGRKVLKAVLTFCMHYLIESLTSKLSSRDCIFPMLLMRTLFLALTNYNLGIIIHILQVMKLSLRNIR